MHTEPDRDFFLLTAMEWVAIRSHWPADAPAYAIATAVTREAAVCHLLLQSGKTADVLARLRDLCRELLGVHLPAPARDTTPDAARTSDTAADLFHRLRLVADPTCCSGVA